MRHVDHILSIGEKHTVREWMVILNTTKANVYSIFKYYNKNIGHLIVGVRTGGRSEAIRAAMEADGKNRTVKEWCSHLGYKPADVRNAMAKYSSLENQVISVVNRTVYRYPESWAKEIAESPEKFTTRQWANRIGVSFDVMHSYISNRKYLKSNIACCSDNKLEQILQSADLIKDILPLPKLELCNKLGIDGSTYRTYESQILEFLGMTRDQVVKRPIKYDIINFINKNPNRYTMADLARTFKVDIAHISRIAHKCGLYEKLGKYVPIKNRVIYNHKHKKNRELAMFLKDEQDLADAAIFEIINVSDHIKNVDSHSKWVNGEIITETRITTLNVW